MRVLLAIALLVPLAGAHSLPHLDVLDAEDETQFLRAASGRRRLAELDDVIPARNLQGDSQPLFASAFGGTPGFYHGVASGDPLPSAVVLWTRYTPVANAPVDLELRIARVDAKLAVEDHLDPAVNRNLRRMAITVNGSSDWVAKIDLTDLQPGTKYVFAFTDGVTSSDVGLTQTAPDKAAKVASMTYAFFSCSHFSNGYFHPYDVASTIKDLDMWIHVGDYVYEYGKYISYASALPERKAQTIPEWEQISLQDHRLRMAQYHQGDEGLRNLRRRAPLMAVWDDHETTNNAYGNGTPEGTGAENHQAVCPATFLSTDAEKSTAKCDRNEGDIVTRLKNAAQSYMEWLPLRRGPGVMGVVDTTSITQVIEWGKLATFVGFDTRISYRSKDPTLGSYFNFFAAAFGNTDVASYKDPATAIGVAMQSAADKAKAFGANPDSTLIGGNINVLRDAWQASKDAGKTWQIWTGATVMAPQIPPSLLRCKDSVPAEFSASMQAYCDGVLKLPTAGLFRAAAAMDLYRQPWNPDDFGGFAVERAAIAEVAKNNANNPVILAGDVHDGWAYTTYEGGIVGPGKPVAVHLVCPGVTSPGWGPLVGGAFPGSPVEAALGTDGVFEMVSKLFKNGNPGMVYGNVQAKGFVAVKMTKTKQFSEFIHITPANMLLDFDEAREESGMITSDFYCGGSFVTTAGQKGSIVEQESCGAIEFDSERPFFWDIPVPVTPIVGTQRITGCNFNACKVSVKAKRKPIKKPKKGKNNLRD